MQEVFAKLQEEVVLVQGKDISENVRNALTNKEDVVAQVVFVSFIVRYL